MFQAIPRIKRWRLFGITVWSYEYDKVVWLPLAKEVVSGLPTNQALNNLSDNVQERRAEDKHTQGVNRLSNPKNTKDKDD